MNLQRPAGSPPGHRWVPEPRPRPRMARHPKKRGPGIVPPMTKARRMAPFVHRISIAPIPACRPAINDWACVFAVPGPRTIAKTRSFLCAVWSTGFPAVRPVFPTTTAAVEGAETSVSKTIEKVQIPPTAAWSASMMTAAPIPAGLAAMFNRATTSVNLATRCLANARATTAACSWARIRAAAPRR